MSASMLHQTQSRPIGMSVAVWLAVFVTPTAYLLSLVLLNHWRMPAPPESVVVLLFCLIPLAALVVCGSVAWRSTLSQRWRVGWLILTVLAMVLQCGALFVVIVSALTVAISPAQ